MARGRALPGSEQDPWNEGSKERGPEKDHLMKQEPASTKP